MPSDRPGSPDPLARLADVLATAADGVRPTPLELAELLWLARQLGPGDEERPALPAAEPAPDLPQEQPRPAREESPPGQEESPAAPEPAPPAPHDPPRVPLHLPSRTPSAPGGHTSLLAPAPPMLRHPLGLQRALRPLKRRTDAPSGHRLDERATADRIARLGAAPEFWLPVLRPAQERWLRLNLVYDTGPTMPVWRPLVHELHTALAQSGIFRTVTLLRAAPDGTVHGHGAHAPADGRTVTLVISDCMGPQWREGPAGALWYESLLRWAHRMPLAVVQPLPERLWRDTALPTTPGRLSAPHPAAPAATLTFTPYERREQHEHHESYDSTVPCDRAVPHGPRGLHGTDGPAPVPVPVPVLESEPAWLAHWAALLTTAGGAQFPAAVAELGRPLPARSGDRTDVGLLSAEELVLRFRATASPEAFRLAGHLAVGRPDLPVMRLVQAALEPDPRPQHLAEVILSGMLAAVPGGPPGSYAFRDGVRDLLLLSLPRTARHRTTELLDRIGEPIDRRAGRAPGEFRASTAAPSGTGTDVDGEAFATVSQDSLRRLSEPAGRGGLFAGRYLLVRPTGSQGTDWVAQDTRRGDETVLVRLYLRPPDWLRIGFADIAQRLSQVDHPGIAAVRDCGTEGDVPYLVREFLDGRSLYQRLRSAPHGLPTGELVALVPSLVEAVNALHAQAGPHGGLVASHVILTPRGPVLDVSSFGIGGRGDDLRVLGHIVRAMHRGPSGDRQHPLPPENLPLPRQLEEELDTAVTELLSDSLETQLCGADRLLRLPPHRERTLGFSLLGPLRVTRDGVPLALDHPEEQALLCVLLLHHGEPATHDELATGLWGPPDRHGSRDLLDTYLSRLRHLLGPDAVTVEGGYALRLDRVSGHDDYDVFRVRRLADEAQRSRTAGDPARSRLLAQEALGLWRGEPLDGVPGPVARHTRDDLNALRRTLGALAEEPENRPEIYFRTDELAGRPEARITLEATVHEILARGSLTPRQYAVLVRPDGYLVRIEPGVFLLPVLVAVLRELPHALARPADRPRLQVTFGPQSYDRTPSAAWDVVVVVPPALYEDFAASSAAQGSVRFRPLFPDDATDTPPSGWYCLLLPASAEPVEHDLVQGPFITHDLHQLGVPTPGRTAVVHSQQDGPFTLLDPVRPYGTRPPRPVTCYSVDLTPQQARHTMSLPSSGKGAFTAVVELSWHVDDPVAFVRGETDGISGILLEHLRDAAERITRGHPLRRAGAAQRAVNAGVGNWPVPGLSVSYAVQLAPEGTAAPVPEQSAASPRRLSSVLADAETVLIGFDGPLARLFSAQTARAAALDLLSVVVEHRDPEHALRGRPPAVAGTAGRETFVHPLDLLRAFARDPLGPQLRARLDDLELDAVPDAPTTHRSVALVRALHHSGRRVSVVTDVGAQAVHRYLEPYRLPLAGIHSRHDDLGLLMPHPDCLQRALDSRGTPVAAGLLISSSIAELTAAQQLGLPFVGYAPTSAGRRRLREEGGDVTVSSLEPLLEAARSL
ncbi:SAV_2336 N-terminal domain-related protein [Streptomyces sp. NPDC016566]|uniref:SAV_2336 N-terminal domain-related protein n=1 Tax=Streptomyces sp. NPDC016566 TaxID=3364967 RepID=UPI0036FF7A41